MPYYSSASMYQMVYLDCLSSSNCVISSPRPPTLRNILPEESRVRISTLWWLSPWWPAADRSPLILLRLRPPIFDVVVVGTQGDLVNLHVVKVLSGISDQAHHPVPFSVIPSSSRTWSWTEFSFVLYFWVKSLAGIAKVICHK